MLKYNFNPRFNKYNFKYYFMIVCSICTFLPPVYSKEFNQAQDAYNKKNYGDSIRYSTVSLYNIFENLISETYNLLPQKNKISSSNTSYSFDIQNGNSQVTVTTKFNYQYSPKLRTRHSFIYAFEEPSYYLAFIKGAKFINYPTKMEIFSLSTPSLGDYLWIEEESTVYYVYEFSNQKEIEGVDSIPGLLFKINFPKNTIHNKTLDTIINELIGEIPWKKLQNLYKVF